MCGGSYMTFPIFSLWCLTPYSTMFHRWVSENGLRPNLCLGVPHFKTQIEAWLKMGNRVSSATVAWFWRLWMWKWADMTPQIPSLLIFFWFPGICVCLKWVPPKPHDWASLAQWNWPQIEYSSMFWTTPIMILLASSSSPTILCPYKNGWCLTQCLDLNPSFSDDHFHDSLFKSP